MARASDVPALRPPKFPVNDLDIPYSICSILIGAVSSKDARQCAELFLFLHERRRSIFQKRQMEAINSSSAIQPGERLQGAYIKGSVCYSSTQGRALGDTGQAAKLRSQEVRCARLPWPMAFKTDNSCRQQ